LSHVLAIAGRELRSLFASPVAYVVLTLWSVLAGTFFLSSLLSFDEQLQQAQQFQASEQLAAMNLNDSLLTPFIASMWIVLMIVLPAVTMGLYSNDKIHGTEELLLTSPIRIGEIVLGKFLAGCGFVTGMLAIVAFYPALLFLYGDPELGKTASGLLGLLLVSYAYVAVGAFASSLTRSQLVASGLSLVLMLVLGMMLPFLVDVGMAVGGHPLTDAALGALRWAATGVHFETLIKGIVDTADLAYFFVVIGIFLLLTQASLESSRWR
jgi:ABC-2 type transport system permease protein